MSVFRVLRTGRRRAELKHSYKYLHFSAVQKKKDESDLGFKISENILLIGGRYLKGNHAEIRENLKKRRATLMLNFDQMVKTYAEYRACITAISDLRRKRNTFSKEVKASKKVSASKEHAYEDGDDSAHLSSGDNKESEGGDSEAEGTNTESSEFKKGVDIKLSIKEMNERMEVLKAELIAMMTHIPNDTHPDVPVGDYSACRVVSTGGSKPEFSFPVRDHMEIGEKHDIIDFGNASTTSGRNFYFLKGAAAMLEMALLQYAMQKAVSKGYHPVITPDIIKEAVVTGCGFDPRDQVAHMYRLMGFSRNLCLSGTAEMPMAGMCVGDLLPRKNLPMKFVAFGRCYRAEAGGSGQQFRGLYRVHQFSKIELFAFTANDSGQESEQMLGEMVDMQKEIAEELGLHYRILEMSTEELGASAYHKYDMEVWMPGRDGYGEVCSASNCTDYQSMRFVTRYHNPLFNKNRKKQPLKKFVHTVNGTAVAVPRMIISLLETHQKEDGSVEFPEALRPFLPPDYWRLETVQPRAWPKSHPELSEPDQ